MARPGHAHVIADARSGRSGVSAAIKTLKARVAAARSEAYPGIEGHLPFIGTFLTRKYEDSGNLDGRIGRTLLSFTSDGHAHLSDAGSSGVPGYQPFSDARGSWRCEEKGAREYELSIVMLDFTFPTIDQPEQKIAHVKVQATFDDATGRISGRTVVSFADLDGNPMDDSERHAPLIYRFDGFKIEVPEH